MEHFERFDVATGQVGRGDLFIGPQGQQVNLSGLKILHSGVDTIRQLYEGRCRPEVLAEIAAAYEAGTASKNAVLVLGRVHWLVGSGGKSGYQFRLQNNDLGLIVFVKSCYVDADTVGTHLKIECSPHYLYDRDACDVQERLDALAVCLLIGARPNGVAVHLAVDVQGWQPSDDFLERFRCRSRRVSSHAGGNVVSFDVSEVAVQYGRRETMTFGTASALQCCIYDKTKEAAKRDKLHFWRQIWEKATDEHSFPDSCFNADKPVTRIEMRFHHSVLRELGLGSDIESVDRVTGEVVQGGDATISYARIADHLQGLWRYAMMLYRLDHSRTYVHPVWTKLTFDPAFGYVSPLVRYRRARKKPGEGNEKNVALAFGNLLSIYARNRFNAAQAWQCLKQSGLWDDLCNYYRRRGVTGDDLFQLVRESLLRRRLMGRAA